MLYVEVFSTVLLSAHNTMLDMDKLILQHTNSRYFVGGLPIEIWEMVIDFAALEDVELSRKLNWIANGSRMIACTQPASFKSKDDIKQRTSNFETYRYRLDLIANEYPSHYKTPSPITAGIRSPLEHLALLQTTGPEREKFATSMLKAYLIHPNVHLRSLHIDDRLFEAKRFHLAKTLFDTCANTLEDLEIAHWGWTEVENIRAIFQPQRFKSLKSASFFCRCNWDALRSAPHIFTIVKSLNRTNVEHFNLSFVIGIREWDLKFPLSELDTIMHECSFPSLVDFGIYICISKIRLERLFEEVKKQLPLMLASGIIVKPMGLGLNRYK
ncbi:hypothetical protein ABKN59_003409 [Abortiporus biennis]